jgi:hypothetical protein
VIRVRNLAAAALVAALTVGGVAACTSSSSASKAQQANNNLAGTTYQEFASAVPYPYAHQAPSDPLERLNLARRLTQYNSKGNTNYVYVFDFAGHVLGYYVIKGKVSSTSSQMTSTDVNVQCGYGGTNESCTNLAIGDDGSYGPDEGGQFGVFFFTTNGTLVETDQPFLVSSAPISIYASVPQLDAPVAAKK